MRITRDLAYGHDSPRQRLDLYLPDARPRALVLWVHGGGWFMGDRALAPGAPQLRTLSRGFALASVGYRLSGEAVFPAPVDDVRAAVRWLRAHADGYDLEVVRIGAWGASAGGHLVAMLGTTGRDEEAVDAVVDWYGPTDFLAMDAQTASIGCREFGGSGHDGPTSPESKLMGFPIRQRADEVRRADPANHVHADVPPFLIQHGTRDCTVPWLQSRHLADAIARAAGADRVTLELLDGVHGGSAFDNDANVDRVLDFLEACLVRDGATRQRG